MNTRRLYRSRTDRAIAGIAGGMAEYLEVDPTVVRILWIVAGLLSGGLVLLLYVILAFVIPLNPFQAGPVPAGAYGTPAWGTTPGQPAPGAAYAAPASPAWNTGWNTQYQAQQAARAERPGRAGLIIGTVLIVFGAIALADVLVPGWISGALFWPAAIIAIGAALLVASVVRREEPAPAAPAAPAASTGFDAAPPASPAPAPEATTAGDPFAGYDSDETTSVPPVTESDRS